MSQRATVYSQRQRDRQNKLQYNIVYVKVYDEYLVS